MVTEQDYIKTQIVKMLEIFVLYHIYKRFRPYICKNAQSPCISKEVAMFLLVFSPYIEYFNNMKYIYI